MLVASGNKYTCSLSPTSAYRIASYGVSYCILQYTDGGKELLTGGADDLVHVSGFSSPRLRKGWWAEGSYCCRNN